MTYGNGLLTRSHPFQPEAPVDAIGDLTMIIVLIKWKITNKQEQIDAFLDYWKDTAVVQDRNGLVGEFLNELGSREKFDYITWDFEDPEGDKYKIFVNVAVWTDADTFQKQIGQYFNDKNPLMPFEFERRVRTVLEPACWRVGDAKLPVRDSKGVQ